MKILIIKGTTITPALTDERDRDYIIFTDQSQFWNNSSPGIIFRQIPQRFNRLGRYYVLDHDYCNTNHRLVFGRINDGMLEE
jgi:hypothetical protein